MNDMKDAGKLRWQILTAMHA